MQKTFTKGEKFIKGFKEKIFPIKLDDEKTEQQTSKKSTKTDFDELNEQIIKEETEINEELFKKYFVLEKPTDILGKLYDSNDKEKNSRLVDIFKSGLFDLENEIKNMSEDEIKIEKPHKIVNVVKKILEFNKQNQSGEGLKHQTKCLIDYQLL